ncbi:hypothetical protein KUTeg_023668 [Tegillarca granosa]|uniref:Uncharacterized protein n=1 Tax=Tegillarca granosa TaxID=220873 RepID=A0ABQ9E8H4_TEGGR|nr:hypothetical protein KUTeg_023668 [Tegillarca granosa]
MVVNELAEKLPWNLKEKWVSGATRYKQQKEVLYTPFSVFVSFLENMADMKHDPAFQFDKKKSQAFCNPQNFKQSRSEYRERNVNEQPSRLVRARKTETVVSSDISNVILCPLHKNDSNLLRRGRKLFWLTVYVLGVAVARNTEQRTVRQQYSVTFVGPHHTLPLYMKLSRYQVKVLKHRSLLSLMFFTLIEIHEKTVPNLENSFDDKTQENSAIFVRRSKCILSNFYPYKTVNSLMMTTQH